MSEMTFEEAVIKLEQVVKKMENDKLPLDESIELYERGIKLSAFCKKKLEDAKLKIETLGETKQETEENTAEA